MTSNEMEDFNEDFVPRSYAAKENLKVSDEDVSTNNTKIRRMSLKEFSGLNDSLSDNSRTETTTTKTTTTTTNTSLDSPLMSRFHNMGSLLEKFSHRRRSSTGLNKLSTWNSEHSEDSRRASEAVTPSSSNNFYDLFNKAIEGINLAIDEATRSHEQNINDKTNNSNSNKEQILPFLTSRSKANLSSKEKVDFKAVFKRLNDLKSTLANALKNLSNQSPIKSQNIQNEKLTILNESRHLVTACKIMIRSTSPNSAINENDLACLMLKAVDSVGRVTESAEIVISKISSLFQAQLFVAKLDQVLSALLETIENMQKVFLSPANVSVETKQLIRSNATLAANLTQLIQTVHRL